MILLKTEISTPILKRDSSTLHHDAAAKSHIVGLDHGDHIAILICCIEIYGAAGIRIIIGVDHRFLCDGLISFPSILFCEKRFGIHPHDPWVCNVVHAICKGHLHGLKHSMIVGSIPSFNLLVLKNVQRHQRHHALTAGWKLHHIISFIVYRKRFHKRRLEHFQVALSEISSMLYGIFFYPLRKLPLIECFCT